MRRNRVIFVGLLLLAVILWTVIGLHGHNIAVLNPQGTIGRQERSLMITATLLSLIVVVPVFTLTFVIAWKYREGNKAKYTPNSDRNIIAETIWWTIPSILIFIISSINWHSSHSLDPFKAISSTAQPVTVQVVSLDWKWLFIYPEQKIASVNYVQFPENTPVNFQITADAPMNSFWIPQLGGQIYAMAGMTTQLHLMADHTGNFNGAGANISGKGFSGMKFVAQATTTDNFNKWVKSAQHSPKHLDNATYKDLVKPSENNPVTIYSLKQSNLYDNIIMKYMMPGMNQ